MKSGDSMKSRKTIKIMIMLISICIILINFNTKVYAIPKEEVDSTTHDGFGDDAGIESFDPTENPRAYNFFGGTSENKLKEKAGVILGFINLIGIAISVIVLALIGIKYMLGSVEEKAEYKKTILMYCLGAAIIFTGSTLPNIIYKLVTGLF